MPEFKFTPDKPAGQMRPGPRKKLREIYARREELVAELEALETAVDRLMTQTIKHLKIETEGAFQGIAVDQDGDVTAVFCPCPGCQAQLNQVTVVEATRAMLEAGHIHGDPAALLKMAAELDGGVRVELLN